MSRDDGQLVTLFGPAGVGKTRIAVGYAAATANRYPDGVHWLPIGALDDPATVITAISGSLGVRTPGQGGVGEIVDHLRHQSCLLIFDNAEHQLATCVALSQALLAEAPGVKIIFTSRHLTGMTAEHPLPINPLPVPAAGQPPEDVIKAPAAELFWTRTGLAGLPAGEQADAVVRICQRVDGLPLALEIAAARTTVLTIGELADTLEAELGILQLTGPRGDEALADAMVGWSHQLLTPKEKQVFAQLAVFGGGFDRDAVAAICDAGLTGVETVDVLASLARSPWSRVGTTAVRMRGSGCCGWFASTREPSWSSRTGPRSCGGDTRRTSAPWPSRPRLTSRRMINTSGWRPSTASWATSATRSAGRCSASPSWPTGSSPHSAAGAICTAATPRAGSGRRTRCRRGPTRRRTLRAPVLELAGTLAFLQCDYAAATTLMTEARELCAPPVIGRGIVWCTSRLGSIAREQGRYSEAERLHTGGARTGPGGRGPASGRQPAQLPQLPQLAARRSGGRRAAGPRGAGPGPRAGGPGGRDLGVDQLGHRGALSRRSWRGRAAVAPVPESRRGAELPGGHRLGDATSSASSPGCAGTPSARSDCSRPASPSTTSSATGGGRPASTTSSPPWRWPAVMRCGRPANWPQPIGCASEIDTPVPAAEQAERTRTVEAARQQLGSVFDVAGLTAGPLARRSARDRPERAGSCPAAASRRRPRGRPAASA